MSKGLFEIPNTWDWAILSDIGSIAAGGTPSTKEEKNFNGNISWLTPADLSDYTRKYISRGKRNLSEQGLKNSSAVLLPKGSILFSSRAPIGYVVIAENPISTNQGFKNITVYEPIFNEYVYYYLKASKRLAEKNASGTTFLEISARSFSNLSIPIPPVPEQHRIITKMDELFTKLDASVEALKLVQAQLKRYRKSVLKAAVEGRLTAEWREQHKDELEPANKLLERILKERRKRWEAKQLATYKAQGKTPSKNWQNKYKKPTPPNTKDLPELPKEWVWTSIDQFSSFVTDGDHNPPKRVTHGIPHLTAKHIKDWKLIEKGCTYISHIDFERVRKRYDPQGDDIVITCVGTIGRTAIVPNNYVFSADRNLALIRLIHVGLHPKYLIYFLETHSAQKLMQNASGSTAQPHFYLADIRKFPVAVPSIMEQDVIIQELERLLSVYNEINTKVETEIKRAQSLRQAILKRAFEGQLVPQYPNDEPASVLLERINAEKANSK